MLTKIIFWVLAFIMTIAAAVYQRKTGPTHPKKYNYTLDGSEWSFKLPRSQNGYKDCLITIPTENQKITGKLVYKRYPSNDAWDTIYLVRDEKALSGWLPKQSAAGKIEYYAQLFIDEKAIILSDNSPAIIRFKDEVPAYALIPHIIFIFTAMLLSTLTGFYALAGISSFRFFIGLTLIFYLIGGMLLGPLVQKFAFGEYWTGFPFGNDLTDNKALLVFVFWILAWAGNLKKSRPYLAVIAAGVNILTGLIPHSFMGSELDYASGEIKTGIMLLF
jgi:hypothetical protein